MNAAASPCADSVATRRVSFFAPALLVIAVALLLLVPSYAPDGIGYWFRPLRLEAPLDLLTLLAAVGVAMLLHECGHLLAALILNFKVLGCSIGPVHFQHLHGEAKVSWRPETFFTASASAVPRSMEHWRQSMMAVIAAGPFATLVGAVVGASLQPTGHAQVLLQTAFVQISLLLFVLGLVPNSRHSRLSNDARLLLDLAQRNEGADEMELKVLLKQQVIRGTRPQDYARDLMARLAAWRGRAETQLAFAQTVSQWALDSDELELADLWDSHALTIAKQCGGRLRNTAVASSACMDVLIREDLETAREKFADVKFGPLFPACFQFRCLAAQEIAMGRLHKAPGFIIRAQYSLPRGIEFYDVERMILERLHMRVLVPRQTDREKARSASA